MKPSLPRARPDALLFSPLAWLKLLWFCHAGPTEVGGFGLSAERNPLCVEDFITVKQCNSPVSVRFDDVAVAELFDRLVDQGVPPHRFGRVWMHTHPGESPLPSAVDEETFARSFGTCDWAVMFIVGRTGQTYVRLSFSAGPGGHMELPVAVNWSEWPSTLSHGPSIDGQVMQWRNEYTAHVHRLPDLASPTPAEADMENWWDSAPWSPALDGDFYEPVPQGEIHELPF